MANLHLTWARASERQLKRVQADAGGGNRRLLECLGGVLSRCGVYRASDKTPHLPIAGASSASPFHEKLRVGLPLLNGAMDGCATFSRLAQVRPKIPRARAMIPRDRGSRFLEEPTHFRWTEGAGGQMKFGRIFAWG